MPGYEKIIGQHWSTTRRESTSSNVDRFRLRSTSVNIQNDFVKARGQRIFGRIQLGQHWSTSVNMLFFPLVNIISTTLEGGDMLTVSPPGSDRSLISIHQGFKPRGLLPLLDPIPELTSSRARSKVLLPKYLRKTAFSLISRLPLTQKHQAKWVTNSRLGNFKTLRSQISSAFYSEVPLLECCTSLSLTSFTNLSQGETSNVVVFKNHA